MRKIICLFLISFLGACTDESATLETLRKAGYSDAKTTGYKYFACSDSDDTHTGFVAKNPKGETVEGVVCCGYFMKACTIRF